MIALGSDIDDIPQASQKPGVAYHDPMIEGAPGHGEGHNSGMPLNIMAAHRGEEGDGARTSAGHASSCGRASPRSCSARRRITCARACSRMWTSCLFAHVGVESRRVLRARRTRTGWCRSSTCSRARAPTRPRRRGADRSALDAVELMDVGWNFRREHLRLAHARPLRDHQRRRPAERGAAERRRLVLLPRGRLRPHHEPVAHRRQHGQGATLMTDTTLHVAPAGQRVARVISTSRSPKTCTRTSRRSGCPRGPTPIRRWRRLCKALS